MYRDTFLKKLVEWKLTSECCHVTFFKERFKGGFGRIFGEIGNFIVCIYVKYI